MQTLQAHRHSDATAPVVPPRIEVSLERKRGLTSRALMRDIAPPEVKNGMLYWLANAAKEAREEAGRLQVHVAAELSTNQSTIARFEDHKGQPKDVDATIRAYAADLEIDPQQIWARALEMWLAREKPTGDRGSAAVRFARSASKSSHAKSPSKPRATRPKRATG